MQTIEFFMHGWPLFSHDLLYIVPRARGGMISLLSRFTGILLLYSRTMDRYLQTLSKETLFQQSLLRCARALIR